MEARRENKKALMILHLYNDLEEDRSKNRDGSIIERSKSSIIKNIT